VWALKLGALKVFPGIDRLQALADFSPFLLVVRRLVDVGAAPEAVGPLAQHGSYAGRAGAQRISVLTAKVPQRVLVFEPVGHLRSSDMVVSP
jgi:hypothetical protein